MISKSRSAFPIVSLFILLTGAPLAAQPADGPEFLLSTTTDQIVSPPATLLDDSSVYSVAAGDSVPRPIEQFLPSWIGLDAMQFLAEDDGLVFSTVRDGLVHDGAGATIVRQNRAYRRDDGGGIELYAPLAALHVRSLDALARVPAALPGVDVGTLGEGDWAFSVSVPEVSFSGGAALILLPGNVYGFDGDRVTLLFELRALGIGNVDALHVLTEGSVSAMAVSSAQDHVVYQAGGLRLVDDTELYFLIPGASTIPTLAGPIFRGGDYGMSNLDAFSELPPPVVATSCPCFAYFDPSETTFGACYDDFIGADRVVGLVEAAECPDSLEVVLAPGADIGLAGTYCRATFPMFDVLPGSDEPQCLLHPAGILEIALDQQGAERCISLLHAIAESEELECVALPDLPGGG
ncbi:MAG: hypothetical protein GY716_23040 [bacterium]|nr:hypothetical protein [bacterium]